MPKKSDFINTRVKTFPIREKVIVQITEKLTADLAGKAESKDFLQKQTVQALAR